uniref:Membrane protein of ER body 2-like isoform X3 n=1 Tax=Nicotiana tabacum TaxID=4097 RepID=A0A1S4C9H9_TOBAC|nr:PREDICTED: membrane protein of ER body 2-like isoform X3 [Nicotiana tabacum]
MAMEVAQHNWKEVVPETAVEAEETVEEALVGRRGRRTANDDGGAVNEEEVNKEEELNNSIYFDKNGGIENLAANLKTIDFQKVLDGVVNGNETGNAKAEILSGVCLPPALGHDSQDETGNSKGKFLSGVCLPPSLGYDSQSSASVTKGSENERIIEEEEVVELEFFDTTAVDKLHTHNAYCPNCSSRITKVVLRRVKRERRIPVETDDRQDLLGCCSCFSIFILIGKKLNPFPLFGSGGGNSVPSGSATEEGKSVPNEEGCFDLHWFLRKRKVTDGRKFTEPGDDWRIPMDDPGASSSTADSSSTQRPLFPVEVKNTKSLEIVKCIVYGGLIESITSLGVVSSAAASDADTTKILTIGVANLIAGFFVICQNLVDLKYNVGGGSNLSDQADRYGELLGQRKHFLLHATFALLSYFIFGLVPPVVYGFAFRKSDDRDYKLIAVAAASLLCIIILAAAKAYTQGANKFSRYLKTIVSYITAAGMASGVGYAAGHLIKRLMDHLGWFDSNPAPSLFIPETISQNPAWASY